MGIGYVCGPADFRTPEQRDASMQRASKIWRTLMTAIDPVEQIKKTIAHLEGDAQYEREVAATHRTNAELADARAESDEATAEEWRKILDREERDNRVIKLTFKADTSEVMDGLRQVADAAKTLGLAEGGIYSGGNLHKFGDDNTREAFIPAKPKDCKCDCDD